MLIFSFFYNWLSDAIFGIINDFYKKKGSFVQNSEFMGKKIRKANNSFLLGSIILFVLLLVVIVLFLFASFKIYDKKESDYSKDRYEIVLDRSTLNSPMTVYMNDSLLFSGTPASQMTLSVDRFAQESSLLVVDGNTDNVSILALPQSSAKVTLVRKGTDFEFAQ